MPPKKKSKGSKLARMTDEERARYLQHRAELELEAKRRKQQLIAVFTKNKLKREEAFSRLNTAKINEQWRYILRQIKCRELYEDVEYLWKNFDRLIKTKNVMIERLYDELKLADMDHKRLQEAHMEMIDKIIGKHKHKLKWLYDSYIHKLKDIESNDMVELMKLRNKMQDSCMALQNIIYGEDIISENKLMETKIKNAVNIYNIVYLKEDSISHHMEQTYSKMEILWNEFNKIILEYENETENKRKQYEYLKEQDDVHQIEVAQYIKSSAQLQNVIEILKADLHGLSMKKNKQINELKHQVEEAKYKLRDTRKHMIAAEMTDSTQLKKLSVTSHEVLKYLEKISEKGSTLLSLIKMNSNLEPLTLSIKKYSLEDIEGNVETSDKCMYEPFNQLEKFWERYNLVKADNIMIKRECGKLLSENKQLRHVLRTYLIAVSRTPNTKSFVSTLA